MVSGTQLLLFTGLLTLVSINGASGILEAWGIIPKHDWNSGHVGGASKDGKKAPVRTKARPTLTTDKENTGVIEVVHLGPLDDDNASRMKRSIDDTYETETNDLNTAEAKVFRPLFVYRQQIAKRNQRSETKQYKNTDDPKAYEKPRINWYWRFG